MTPVFWPSTGKKRRPGFVVSVWWGGQVSGMNISRVLLGQLSACRWFFFCIDQCEADEVAEDRAVGRGGVLGQSPGDCSIWCPWCVLVRTHTL